MKTMRLSEAKAHLIEVADDVASTHERITVTRNGRATIVIIAPDDLESMEATIELFSDQPALTRIATAEDEIARGEGLNEQAVRALLTGKGEEREMGAGS
jgi:prevent-host-death family protein